MTTCPICRGQAPHDPSDPRPWCVTCYRAWLDQEHDHGDDAVAAAEWAADRARRAERRRSLPLPGDELRAIAAAAEAR